MSLHLCVDCLDRGDRALLVASDAAASPHPNAAWGRVASLRAYLVGFLGGLIRLLTGNPVVVLVGASAGILASGVSTSTRRSGEAMTQALATCDRCGKPGELEVCELCHRGLCRQCRRLVLAQEEQDGRTVYRHYERADEDAAADGSFSLMPPMAGDEPAAGLTQAAYRLGDELFVLDEETGELIPLADDAQQPEGETHPSDAGGSEAASQLDGWGEANASSSPDWESGSWDSAEADGEEGGGDG